jgi:hypothetical protein
MEVNSQFHALAFLSQGKELLVPLDERLDPKSVRRKISASNKNLNLLPLCSKAITIIII